MLGAKGSFRHQALLVVFHDLFSTKQCEDSYVIYLLQYTSAVVLDNGLSWIIYNGRTIQITHSSYQNIPRFTLLCHIIVSYNLWWKKSYWGKKLKIHVNMKEVENHFVFIFENIMWQELGMRNTNC